MALRFSPLQAVHAHPCPHACTHTAMRFFSCQPWLQPTTQSLAGSGAVFHWRMLPLLLSLLLPFAPLLLFLHASFQSTFATRTLRLAPFTGPFFFLRSETNQSSRILFQQHFSWERIQSTEKEQIAKLLRAFKIDTFSCGMQQLLNELARRRHVRAADE